MPHRPIFKNVEAVAWVAIVTVRFGRDAWWEIGATDTRSRVIEWYLNIGGDLIVVICRGGKE